MPNPVTHILIAIILAELFRDHFIKDSRKFPRYYILAAAFAGIIPDLDFIAYYVLYFFGFAAEEVHRTFLHSMFVSIALLLIGIILLKANAKNKWVGERHIKLSTIFFIFSAGSLLHLILDAILFGEVMLFYPFSKLSIGVNILMIFPEGLQWMIPHTLDSILLFFWLFWMEFKLNVRDYF